MPAPAEHKTVQARLLEYAQEIGWRFVPWDEAAPAYKVSLYFVHSF
jgi:hypothetical protein